MLFKRFVALLALVFGFIGVVACMAGEDLAVMDRLPNTDGLRNDVIHRAHRSPFDHAVRATGAKLVEVGYLGGASSPGTRGWEVESATQSAPARSSM